MTQSSSINTMYSLVEVSTNRDNAGPIPTLPSSCSIQIMSCCISNILSSSSNGLPLLNTYRFVADSNKPLFCQLAKEARNAFAFRYNNTSKSNEPDRVPEGASTRVEVLCVRGPLSTGGTQIFASCWVNCGSTGTAWIVWLYIWPNVDPSNPCNHIVNWCWPNGKRLKGKVGRKTSQPKSIAWFSVANNGESKRPHNTYNSGSNWWIEKSAAPLIINSTWIEVEWANT